MLTRVKAAGQILLIPQASIVPNKNQPRKLFNHDALEELAESIRQNGILQPLIVRSLENGTYELIAGERRLRAARIVGMDRLPCIVMRVSDEKSAVLALLENLQRQNLDFFEEAEAMVHIMLLYRLSQEELAAKLGKAPSTVSNKLRLLRLPEDIRYAIMKNHLTERHARALLKLPNEAQMRALVQVISEQHLNVSETEKRIEKMLADSPAARKQPIKFFKDIRIFVNTVNHAVDTMRNAGVPAQSQKKETETYIEYTIRIPKNKS